MTFDLDLPSGAGRPRRFALSLALALSVGLGACAPDVDRRPNVVFVTLDTLSVRYVSPYGAAAGLTPHLTALAAEGALFEHAYTQVPLTLPSHTTLFSGRDPASTGVIHNRSRVAPELALLPEILAQRGYRTGGFISLGVVNAESGLQRGFETFADPFPPGAWPWYRNADRVLADVEPWLRTEDDRPFFAWVHFSDPHGPYLPAEIEPDTELAVDGRPVGRYALQTTERYEVELTLAPGRHTVTWTALRPPPERERRRPRNVLEVVPLPSPAMGFAPQPPDEEGMLLTPSAGVELTVPGDEPVTVPLAFRGSLLHPTTSEARANYRSEVRTVDRHLGKLRDLVEEVGAAGDTLWIVASDHGEGLRHHGSMGHADEVYEDQLRIAWILAGPGVPRGVRVGGGPVLNDSVLPTLLDLLGAPHPPGLTGRSRIACLRGGECEPRSPWWSYCVPPRQRGPLPVAGYSWPYKVVDEGGELPAVFDLVEDPWETRPLPLAELRSERAVVDLLRGLEAGREQWVERTRPAEAIPVDPDREQALRALGYLDG